MTQRHAADLCNSKVGGLIQRRLKKQKKKIKHQRRRRRNDERSCILIRFSSQQLPSSLSQQSISSLFVNRDFSLFWSCKDTITDTIVSRRRAEQDEGLNLLPPSVCSFIDSRALWELIYTYIYINTYIHCFNAAITFFVCCLLCVTKAASHQHNTLTVTLMLADSSRIYCCSSDSAHAGLPQQSAQFEVQNKKSGIITTLRNTQRHQSSTKTDYHSIRFL